LAPRISLALAIHNHQPVGNFGWVFAEVYDRAYLPLLEALERHPGVRLSLHYTGPLLEWIAAERPDFLERLGGLVRPGQVELLGGGLYEPILASLPEHDRIDQLTRMAATIERITGSRPRGAWLAERVWEPDLPTALVRAGYQWTILDDQHFRAAAIPEENLWGAYTTEDQGNLLTVFGTEQGLRYRIPFGTVEDVISYLRDHATEAGDRVGMMGDDGEKFGSWPTTYEHCWGSGRWVERFFEALEANADWLSTVTPSQWLAKEPPIGRVYVPTSSYAEMGEWALPPDETVVFTGLLHDAVARSDPAARWLRGGFWRNFQVKYREINDLHKQMLRASAKVAAMPDGPAKDIALDHLHRGQSNDCYWHGLFGGIYISHMRLATHEHLIAAEDAADAALGTQRAFEQLDLDLDGRLEVRLAEAGQVVTVKPSEGGGIGAWDIRAARHALASVLRRRPEAYHETLRAHDAREAEHAAAHPVEHAADHAADHAAEHAAETADEAPGGGVTSIHDVVTVKEEGLASRLHYDTHERRTGIVRFLEPGVTPEAVATATERELADFGDALFSVDHLAPGQVSLSREGTVLGQPVGLSKTIRLEGGRLDPALTLDIELHHRGDEAVDARLGIELALHLLGGGGNPSAWYDVRGERSAHDGTGQAAAIEAIGFGNDWVGVAVEARAEPAADAWWSPIETVSNSESGFERVYQGSSLLLSWPVRLEPGQVRRFSIRQQVAVARDRATDEAAAGA
jgi:alpha-amylase